MLLHNQLSQKRQRLRWINIACWIVLASSTEALPGMGLDAVAASPGQDSKLTEIQMPDRSVTSAEFPLAASAVTKCGVSRIALPTELEENLPKGTSSIGQKVVTNTNSWNLSSPYVKVFPSSQNAQLIAEQEGALENHPATVERYPLPTENDLESLPHRGAADLLFSNGENGSSCDRASEAGESQSNCQPTPPPDRSAQSQTDNNDGDPELGILRLRQPEMPPPASPLKPPPTPPPAPSRQSTPILHLLPRISYFQTDNIFSSVDPVGDSLIYPSLTLWAVPQIGQNTFLTPSIEGSLIRYIKQPEFNYNLLRFRTGISQRLNRQMFGEIGWNHQQFYRAEVGDRFLSEHMVYLSLSRQDQLTQRLRLNSFYDLRVSFADPDYRSRIINSLYLSLSYSFQSNLLVALDYQMERSDFTVRDRYDQYHRIMGRLTYGVLRDSQISVSGGVSVGGSSEPFIDFDSLFFSVTYSVDFPIY